MMSNYEQTMGKELGWDDSIEKESNFILLPEGTYDYTVKTVERGRFPGSDKMCACNMATVTLTVSDPASGEEVDIRDNLYLNSKAEWKLSQFFLSIGQKKHGEPLRMNWNAVPGSKGRCEISVNRYSKDGQDRENNRVKTYLDFAPKFQKGSF